MKVLFIISVVLFLTMQMVVLEIIGKIGMPDWVSFLYYMLAVVFFVTGSAFVSHFIADIEDLKKEVEELKEKEKND